MSVDPRFGCLLKEVKLEGLTTEGVLFDDTFSTDNLVYVPPRCGMGTTSVPGFGHYTGYDCDYLNTCLNEPPGIQVTDPNPLPDIESGQSGPAKTYTSTKQVCVSCPVGQVNLAVTPLTPTVSDSGTSNVQGALSGLKWLIPILDQFNDVVDPADQQEAITGNTTVTAMLLFRGLIELKHAPSGSTPVPGLSTQNIVYPASYPLSSVPTDAIITPTDSQNEYSIEISNPPQFYLLNCTNGPENGRPYPVDYQFSVQIAAGATVTLRARTIDDHEWPNADEYKITAKPGEPPILVAQNSALAVPPGAFYQGQFLQMDVLGVSGQTGTTLPFVRLFTFSEAAEVDNYTVSNAITAVNYPTTWVMEGSSDGSTWNNLDTRSNQVFTPGQNKRFPIETPASYLYYRLTITGTADGHVPSLSQSNLYGPAPSSVCASATATSAISQEDADAAAVTAATPAANAQLNCQPVFTSGAQSYDATNQTTGQSFSATSVKRSLNSRIEADQQAFQDAKAQADLLAA